MALMYVSFQDDDRIAIFAQDAATGALRRKQDVAVEGGEEPARRREGPDAGADGARDAIAGSGARARGGASRGDD